MKYFKTAFSFLFLATLISCGGRNESEEKNKKETNITETPKVVPDTLDSEAPNDTTTVNSTDKDYDTTKDSLNNSKGSLKTNIDKKSHKTNTSPAAKKAAAVINSPLKNLLNTAQIGKSYTKKELIEEYKFPKEAVDLVKHVTCVGHNKLYFKWGNT
jgi:hypothetical protein